MSCGLPSKIQTRISAHRIILIILIVSCTRHTISGVRADRTHSASTARRPSASEQRTSSIDNDTVIPKVFVNRPTRIYNSSDKLQTLSPWPLNKPEPTWHGISFRKVHNQTECVLEKNNNQTIVSDGLLTFNFYDGPLGQVTTYSIPKCLFATREAQMMLESVDFSESLEQYQRRFNSYLLTHTNSLFVFTDLTLHTEASDFNTTHRLIDHENPLLNLPHTHVEHNHQLFVKTRAMYTIPYNGCYLFSRHTVLFPVEMPCVQQRLDTSDGWIQNIVSPFFFSILVHSATRGDIVILFGELSKRVFVKSPYVYTDFLLKNNKLHDLLVIVESADIQERYPFILKKGLFEEFLSLPYHLSLYSIVNKLQELSAQMIVDHHCYHFDEVTLRLLFGYQLFSFISQRHPYLDEEGYYVDYKAYIQTYARFNQIRNFIIRCFKVPDLFQYHTHLNVSNTVLLAERRGYFSNWSPETWLYVWSSVQTPRSSPTPTNRDRSKFFKLISHLHEKHLIDTNLTPQDRQLLALFGTLNDALAVLYQTSLCSPQELLNWRNAMTRPKVRLDEMYTPCMDGGRHDINGDILRRLFDSDRSHITNARTVLSAEQALLVGRQNKHRLSCIPSDIPYTLIHTPKTRYLISKTVLVQGTCYTLTNMIVGQSLVITAIDPGCVRTTLRHKTAEIMPLTNVTVTRSSCDLCESVLLEYNELYGLTDLTYLHSFEDLSLILSPQSPLSHSSPQTHFLLLLSNGTVCDVSTIFLDIKESSILFTVILVIIILLVIFGLYRLFRLL